MASQFPFESYLMALQQKNQRDPLMQLASTVGGVSKQIGDKVETHRRTLAKDKAVKFKTLIDAGFEPRVGDAPLKGETINQLLSGSDVPGLEWVKVDKDEMVIPTDVEIQAAKQRGIELPTGVPQRKSSIGKWITPKTMSAQTTGISLENATPGQIATARALIRGDILTENLGTRDRGITTQLAVELSEKEGIPFQSYQGNVRKGMASNLASGKMGFNALSLNTGIGHAGDAMKAFNNIQNTDIKMLNTPLNILKKNTNDPNIIELELNLNALSGELATIFKGSAGTDQEIKHWMDVLTPNLTPLQAKMAMQKVAELLTSRLNAIEYQQQDVMTNPVGERELISPKSKKTMKELSGETAGVGDDPLGLFK